MTDLEISRRKQLQEDLWVAAQAYESLLRQKSRSRWLKEGNCNTRYFHIMTNANRNRNCIKGLLIEDIWRYKYSFRICTVLFAEMLKRRHLIYSSIASSSNQFGGNRCLG